MLKIPSYNPEVYDKVSQLTGLNFKAQLKDSGIEFRKIYKMTDMLNEEISYLLVTDKLGVVFKNRDEFLDKFILQLRSRLADLNQELE
ncbi:hypothetical protein AB9P05_01005 [Roseivirga sp. BDSF3-8]|uniref:hypothetical protein n=1 Tax=Roseivirga sp. BDSF3-8 TaxID=3241598 RepID=UPI0035327DB5